MNRVHALLARMARSAAGFESQPEPRTIGNYARGRNLVAGNHMFAGFLVEAPDAMAWDLPMPDAAFETELHGFSWLDDLAAVGDLAARHKAQSWTHEWVRRYGGGRGPGWTPDLTGRRLIRWINHSILLLNGRDRRESAAYFKSLSQQTAFLSRRWRAATPGLPRFEALTGLIYAGLALTGMERHVGTASRALARECGRRIDADGGIASRNPEELLEIFTLLNWASEALTEAGRMPGREHLAAVAAMAPVLRTLRHVDGALARFHGGGRGVDGRLDQALASSGVRPLPPSGGLAMGYARLMQGRTSVIVDAAPPPAGEASVNAHASTLAFELSSGRRPMIVNCGSGVTFGQSWRRAGRATQSHSTLALDGLSSSRLGPATGRNRGAEWLTDVPRDVRAIPLSEDGGIGLELGHDGYFATHGLAHLRRLVLSSDGRSLAGEDALLAMDQQGERRFDAAFHKARPRGIRFAVRFHLHPDVDAKRDMGGSAVSLALKSGEIWVFRFDGPVTLSLDSSVYLERNRMMPRATRQIVLSGTALDYSTRVGWTLSKAQDTPSYVRDFSFEEPMAQD